MTRLADLVNGRENNYHLIRMVAASMVLVSHSVALATGDAQQEPWRALLGVTPGSVAVDIFFVVSGLLVTQSLDRRQGAVLPFARARFLRIWPGLLVALLLTVFGLGLWLSTLPAQDYLTHPGVWKHLALNSTLFWRIDYVLPGVFDGKGFNGSLWTLTYEVRAYAFLVLAWVVAQRVLRGRVPAKTLVLGLLVVLAASHLWQIASVAVEHSTARLYAMFFAGSAAYLWRERLSVHPGLTVAALAVVLVSTQHALAFAYVYSLLLPLVVIGLAYTASGPLMNYNRMGDYSYGMYIYAYPVQQSVAWLWPGCTPSFMTAVAGTVTLCLAVISWHVVENPVIRWSSRRREAR